MNGISFEDDEDLKLSNIEETAFVQLSVFMKTKFDIRRLRQLVITQRTLGHTSEIEDGKCARLNRQQ